VCLSTVCGFSSSFMSGSGAHAIAAAWQLPTPGVTPPGRSNVAALAAFLFRSMWYHTIMVWVARTCATFGPTTASAGSWPSF
jgi:hypothetical protein